MSRKATLPSLSALTLDTPHRQRAAAHSIGAPADDAAFTRCTDAVPIQRLDEWASELQANNSTGYRAFVLAADAIARKQRRLCAVVSKQLALTYKQGLDPFPTHFEWSGVTYELLEPGVMEELTSKGRKRHALLLPVLESVTHENTDAFATLIIALTTAGKIVTHWSELPDDD